MPRLFKHFVQPPKKTREEKFDEGIIIAFGRGQAAARRGKSVDANPYKWDFKVEFREAWLLGHKEETSS